MNDPIAAILTHFREARDADDQATCIAKHEQAQAALARAVKAGESGFLIDLADFIETNIGAAQKNTAKEWS